MHLEALRYHVLMCTFEFSEKRNIKHRERGNPTEILKDRISRVKLRSEGSSAKMINNKVNAISTHRMFLRHFSGTVQTSIEKTGRLYPKSNSLFPSSLAVHRTEPVPSAAGLPRSSINLFVCSKKRISLQLHAAYVL